MPLQSPLHAQEVVRSVNGERNHKGSPNPLSLLKTGPNSGTKPEERPKAALFFRKFNSVLSYPQKPASNLLTLAFRLRTVSIKGNLLFEVRRADCLKELFRTATPTHGVHMLKLKKI